MIEVVTIRFKNRGKCYTFAPNGLDIHTGDKVIVETSKGLEIAECSHGNHMAEETGLVLPLRPVARVATADDLRVAELNKKREKEAFQICQEKIAEHGLEMKLVDVECNFEGNKTMFFFTADGRVDFRELVKDLAGIFRNRIELRQIGVRDEARMIGGIGICGRPYCCSQFLEDFQPVSTKMAKVQSLSLNPTKISGSCGRLMCCLRYEQEAYEDLIKKVPKQGAFVETIDGYGTAAQVNLLRQTVKVKLDTDKDDSLRVYKANELAAVPGGRPKDGEEPPHVLQYVEPEPELPEDKEDEWTVPGYLLPEEPRSAEQPEQKPEPTETKAGRRGRGGRSKGKKDERSGRETDEKQAEPAKKPEQGRRNEKQPHQKVEASPREKESGKSEGKKRSNNRRRSHVKAVKVEAKGEQKPREKAEQPRKEAAPKKEDAARPEGQKHGGHRRRSHNKPKPQDEKS